MKALVVQCRRAFTSMFTTGFVVAEPRRRFGKDKVVLASLFDLEGAAENGELERVKGGRMNKKEELVEE